jgi:antitoxin HicB
MIMGNAKLAGQEAPTPRFADFDDYLRHRGIKEKIDAAVEKRIVALQLDRCRKEANISKAELARMIGTSRTQIDRILDPKSANLSLATLNRAARALGKKVLYELVDL